MAKKFTVLFQGDSITDCGRMSCGGAGFTNENMGPGYPGMAAARLLCDRPEIDWSFFNRGISGNRVVDLYARWKCDGINLKPNLVSILIGVNDTWHEVGSKNGVEVPRYERFYREILQWTRDELPKVKFILMEPFILDVGTLPPEGVAEVKERAVVTKKLAKEFGAAFVPCQSILDKQLKTTKPEHWSKDGVHPTAAGHQLLTDAWLKAAKDLLP